jgi:hypothetical protein
MFWLNEEITSLNFFIYKMGVAPPTHECVKCMNVMVLSVRGNIRQSPEPGITTGEHGWW